MEYEVLSLFTRYKTTLDKKNHHKKVSLVEQDRVSLPENLRSTASFMLFFNFHCFAKIKSKKQEMCYREFSVYLQVSHNKKTM